MDSLLRDAWGPKNGKVLCYVLGILLRTSQSGDQLGRFKNLIMVVYGSVSLLKIVTILKISGFMVYNLYLSKVVKNNSELKVFQPFTLKSQCLQKGGGNKHEVWKIDQW